jgi:hypothetical protein
MSNLSKKEELQKQIKGLQSKIEELDKHRYDFIGRLAKKYNLSNLPDEVLKTEFEAIAARHLKEAAAAKKNS